MASLAKLTTVDVSSVSGLAGSRTAILAKAGIHSVADLLLHVPHRYVDRSQTEPIAQIRRGVEVTVVGEVKSVSSRRPRRNMEIIEASIADESAAIRAVWFNQGFRKRQLGQGSVVALSGKVESYQGRLQMKSPDVDVIDSPTEGLLTGRIVPIHTGVGRVTPGVLRRAIHNALARSRPIPDPVPQRLREKRELMGRDAAIASIHFPESMVLQNRARARLVYDELFRLELALAVQKRLQIDDAVGIAHTISGEMAGRFVAGLPYDLTSAQLRVLVEIETDLRRSHPMHRLLQGEVGSGKTVVAVATMLHGVEGGYQAALMAPTEVLAEQHFLGVRSLLEESGMAPAELGRGHELGMASLFTNESGRSVRLALLTGSHAVANHKPGINRTELIEEVAAGEVDIVVGTHALIQEGVGFAALGVAVVDEQHRFGVGQRVLLKEKGIDPDLLIMTATPIPRTLTMTIYGDLDVSLIDEMPPGRHAVVTSHLSRGDESQAWDVVRSEVARGGQAFVVCPLVKDSPKVEAASAEAEYERLKGILEGVAVGLIHGQMPPRDKEAIMAAVRAGTIDVLVATTVIEVGIDVPNATVMVVEDADRFGLSQLHQLRGRVGRGEQRSLCILIADPTTDEAAERIAAMVATNDGFRLAEEDLRIRGQGAVFGARQSGVADLRLADVLRDTDTLVAARTDAFDLVAGDPGLEGHVELRDEVLALLGEDVEWLFRS